MVKVSKTCDQNAFFIINIYFLDEILIDSIFFLGTGYAQGLSAVYVVSYYMSIVGLCLYYLVMSFQSTLPWAVCQPEWENCVPSGQTANLTELDGEPKSSAELYFT